MDVLLNFSFRIKIGLVIFQTTFRSVFFFRLSVRVTGDVTAFYTTILQGGAGVTGAKSSSRWAFKLHHYSII